MRSSRSRRVLRQAFPLAMLAAFFSPAWISADETYDLLLAGARGEVRQGDLVEAAAICTEAIRVQPQTAGAFILRGRLHELGGRLADAEWDYGRALLRQPDAGLFDARGAVRFKLGMIDASIEDFDAAIDRDATRKPWHWQRGISYYYAGRWEDGRKQFEGYQTVDDSDVENAVWRFLCMSRGKDFATARKEILRIGNDRRIPMRQVYDLFAGKSEPEDVVKAIPPDDRSGAFYGQLYLGLYFEASGDLAKAKEHLRRAAARRIEHYMGDVAEVHLRLRGWDRDAAPAPADDPKK